MPGKTCLTSESSRYTDKFGMEMVTRVYRSSGWGSRALAEQAVLVDPILCPLLDPDYTDLARDDAECTEINALPDNYEVTVNWRRWIPDAIGDEIIAGATGTQSVRIRTAVNHIGSYAPSGLPQMNSYGMLNVTPDGIEGLDVEFPVVYFSIQKTYAKGTKATLSNIANLSNYAHKPNSIAWRGFGEQVVKIVGTNTSGFDDNEDQVTYDFAASPTFTNIVIPTPFGNITVPEKKGWQYLHLSYAKYHDSTTGWTTDVPIQAHLDEVQRTVDLNAILP